MSKAHEAFYQLKTLISQRELTISEKKLIPLSTCLGIEIDAVASTSICDAKLQEILQICKAWQSKTCCTVREL